MIRHLVLARLPEGSTAEWDAIVASLRELVSELNGAESLLSGANVSPEAGLDQGFSEAFVIDFADEAARDAYLVDPRHVALGERIVALAGGVQGLIVVDLVQS